MTETCGASTSCRDPNEPEPCYSAHFCTLDTGHLGEHYSPDHSGLEWTDSTTRFPTDEATE